MKQPPITISPRMAEDIKRIPALATLLERGEIEIRKAKLEEAMLLGGGSAAYTVQGDGSIKVHPLEEIYK